MTRIAPIRPIQAHPMEISAHFGAKRRAESGINETKTAIETALNQADFIDTTVRIQETMNNKKVLRIYPQQLTQVPAILSTLLTAASLATQDKKGNNASILSPEATAIQEALQTAGIPGVVWRTLRAPEQQVYNIALPEDYFKDKDKKEALHNLLFNLPNISSKSKLEDEFKTYSIGIGPQRQSFTNQIIECGFIMTALIHNQMVEFWLKDNPA